MSYLLNYPELVLEMIADHILIAFGSLILAALIALPLGWFLFYRRRFVGPVLGVLGIIYTIPSIALIIFLIPLFGLNARSVVASLVLYGQVVLVRNVLAGLNGIDPAVLEAARGLGMTRWQLSWKIQLPLALPVILAGIRIAAVVSIAIATIGAKFGAGGLGTLLFDGISQNRIDKIWLGAIFVSLLAFGAHFLLVTVERRTGKWRTA